MRGHCATHRRLGALALLTLLPGAVLASVEGPPTLVLSELMVNPLALPDSEGEWIELYNYGDAPVALDGLSIAVDDIAEARLDGLDAPAVPSHAYVVATRLPAPYAELAPIPEADILVDVAFLLPNVGGTVRLLWEGGILDEVTYGTDRLPVPTGASLNREPVWQRSGGHPALGNASGWGAWCEARSPIANRDGDFGTPGAENTWCDGDGDGAAEDEGDCDDGNGAAYLGATEICNGCDDDCDGTTDEADMLPASLVCPAEGACAASGPACHGAGGWVCLTPDGYEREETRCDGLDNDCDGDTDEGLRNACGGCGLVTHDDCNGADDDCDGQTDEDAASEPRALCLTEGVCASAARRCRGAAGWECAYPPTFEADEERSCDALDNDCDGATDEPFAIGSPCIVGVGACASAGVLTCHTDLASTVCDAQPRPARVERCGDALDNDCDGDTDEGFELRADCVVGLGACRAFGKPVCGADGLSVVCSATPATPGDETCANGVDDDCDGDTDEVACRTDDPAATLPTGCAAGEGVPEAGLPLVLAVSALAALLGRIKRRRDAY